MGSPSWSTSTRFRRSCQRSRSAFMRVKTPLDGNRSNTGAMTRPGCCIPTSNGPRSPRARLALARLLRWPQRLPELEVSASDVVRLPKPHPGMLFGKGKMTELSRCRGRGIELVLIDGPVTPVQQRNLEKAWGVKLLDRTGLILEIFSDRAAPAKGCCRSKWPR